MDKKVKPYLTYKRNELIWALSAQGYSNIDIGVIFNINRSTVLRVMLKKPNDWVTPWFKITSLK